MHDVRPGLPPVLQAYRRLVARRVLILAGLLVLCMAAFLLDLVTGPSSLTLQVAGASTAIVTGPLGA